MEAEDFINRYYQWLLNQAFASKQRQTMYHGVLRVLFDIPFYSSFQMDENRAGDASCYRQYARYELDQEPHHISKDWLDQWEQAMPSVFEVLIGIAERWSQFFEQPVPYYFNHLFRNMGFHQFRGEGLRSSEEEAVRWTVDNWLSRQIEKNGDGSPFPVKPGRDPVDMRLLDIWRQMNAYSFQHFQ